MTEKATIYGKATCPFTKAAIDDYTSRGISFHYIDVIERADQLDTMLKFSKGERKIPVIVEDNKITIGFNGKC